MYITMAWFMYVVCLSFVLPVFGKNFTEKDDILGSNHVGHTFFTSYRSILLRNNNIRDFTRCVQDLFAKKLLYIDAAGKPRSGAFFGNLLWMGSVSECRNITNSHYCGVGLKIAYEKISLPVTWTACFPTSCNATDISKLLVNILIPMVKAQVPALEMNVTSSICPGEPKYTSGVKVALTISGLVLFLCLLGTIYDWFSEVQLRARDELSEKTFYSMVISRDSDIKPLTANDHVSEVTASLNIEDDKVVSFQKNKVLDVACDVILCFSLIRNTRKIFNTKVPATAITCINGLRVISITWVIIGHTFSAFFGEPVENKASVVTDARRLSIMPIINGFYSVDSFFFLSGLLVAYTCLRKMQKSNGKLNWAVFYVHRFFRLTPAYMYLILFSVYLKRFLSSGPLYYTQYEDKACSKYWWTNLLYINNFYPTNGMACVGWSWYLANDMQFFVITPPLVYLLYKFGWRALSAPLVLIGCSTITLICLYSHYELDPFNIMKGIARVNLERSANSDFMKYFKYIYVKPYCRIQPYLVGFILGFAFNINYQWMKKPSWFVTLLGWFIAAVVGLAIVYGPHYAILPGVKDWNVASMTVYGSFERLVWGLVLAWVTYACHYKAGGLVQMFLSANFWIPLSRLTYSVYLIHLILIPAMINGAMGTIHFDMFTASYYFLAVVVLSYGAGFILSVCIEFPCDNLENLMIKYYSSYRKKRAALTDFI